MKRTVKEGLEKSFANDIVKELENEKYNINWKQIKSRNCYTTIMRLLVTIDGTDYTITPLKSYNTIVGFYSHDVNTFYEVGKYSTTTSKQVTQFCNENNFGNRVYCDRI